MSFDAGPREWTHEIRAWAVEQVQALLRNSNTPYARELATVRSGWLSQGQGWPHAVGPIDRTSRIRVIAHRYEVVVTLPPDLGELAEGIGTALMKAAEADGTLGGRVRDARIHPTDFSPDLVDDEDFGSGSYQVIVPVVVYDVVEEREDGA